MENTHHQINERMEPFEGLSAPLAEQEYHKIVVVWNQTQAEFPHEKLVHELFEEQVVRSPNALALIFDDKQLTYFELNAQANRLAHHLRAGGIGPNSLVGVCAERSIEFVVSILSVLKAGAAYVPLDPEYPQDRLRFIVADAKLDALICDGTVEVAFAESHCRMVHLRREEVQISARTHTNPDRLNSCPENLAYVMFTSGSTGRPKGVCMPHRPLVNLLHWQNRQSVTGAAQRTLQFAPLGFDVCFQETLSTLSSGGRLIVISQKERKDFLGLIHLIEQREITRLFLPFVALEFLAEVVMNTGQTPKSLQEVITAGEQLRITPAIRSLFGRLPGARLVNQYGPTEAHVVSAYELSGDPAGWPYMPSIGRPISNTQLYILDRQLKPVAVSVIGELFIGGVQVAQGYLGRPGLTAEKFIADPFSATPGARLYRTGDLARYLPDGNIEFLGRTDDQVKIRGFRVELGEVETTLAEHPEVQRVVVTVREDEPGVRFLAAYVTSQNQSAQFVSQLREFLHQRLPGYMVPAVFVLLPVFPLTPNGKIDRKALPVPTLDHFDSGAAYAAPRTPDEQRLAAVWSEVLGVAKVGLHDNFFIMGGDSLLAIRLILAVEKITGQWLELSTFLLDPTLAGMSTVIRERQLHAEAEIVVAIRKTGTRPPLFCLYNFTGDVDVYIHLAKALGEDQPVTGIRSPALTDICQLPPSIESAASEMVRCIRKIQPRGTPLLVGYSWAGLLAFEVARQFKQTEGIDCFTALIGPDAPMRPTNLILRGLHFIRYFPLWLWRQGGLAKIGQRLRHWRGIARSTQQNFMKPQVVIPGWAESPVSQHHIGLVNNYEPLTSPNIAVDIFREQDEYQAQANPLQAWQTKHLADGGWDRWTGKRNRIHWVPGDHWNVIKPPAVTSLAKALRQAMDEFINKPF
jgi:amino acid adenylation domain-containing protein